MAMGRLLLRGLVLVILAIGCGTPTTPFEEPDTGPTMMDASACTTMCNGQCSSGKAKCGDVCVDVKVDNANCGKCGTVCGGPDAGAIMGGGMWGCTSGTCSVICPTGKTDCSSACVDTKTDNDNCGMCGTACTPMTEQCTEGQCCKTGEKSCNGMCTNVQSDTKNCGMCGTACPMNMPLCVNGKCTTSIFAQLFPPTGGNASGRVYWSARYYTVTFSQQSTILAVEWMANLGGNDFIRAGIWNPMNQQKLATGNPVNGNGTLKYHRSTINFTAAARTPYIVGVFISNGQTEFPRKDSPSYPFLTNGIIVTACWSTTDAKTDIFPTSSNSWAPDFRLELLQ